MIAGVLSCIGRPPVVSAATGTLKQINFQGKVVTKTTGVNIADGSYSFTFRIYDVASAGTHIWTETKSITVTNGIFQTLLGDTTALPGSVDFNTDNIYLGINFNGDGEMSPRVRFAAVPQALNALKVAGLTVTDTTGTLTIPNGETISFAESFTTSGANPLTLTTTGTTNVTLPTTGTLETLAGVEVLTNKTIGSTGLVFSGATTDIDTAAAEGLALQGRAASSFSTTSGAITFQAAGTGTVSTIQIGAGGAGSTTPDYLALDVKSDTGDPAGGAEGYVYYNTFDNVFRCYQNAGWTNCIGAGGSAALDTLTAATTDDVALTNGDNTLIWEWALTSAASRGLTLGETSAATGGSGDQFLLELTTDSGSTAGPLSVISNSADAGDIEFNLASAGDFLLQDAGTTFFAFSDDKNVTYDPLNTAGMTITSSLAGGARSTDVLTITQASDVTNDSTQNLLQLTNADSGSTAALLQITQNPAGTALALSQSGVGAGGTAMTINSAGAGSGRGIDFTGYLGSSSRGISFSGTSSASDNFSGDLITVDQVFTHNTAATNTFSGNFVDIKRNDITNHASSIFNITGDLVNFQSSCTQTLGTCTDTSNILSLAQNYASATGAVIELSNSGTGADIDFNSTTPTLAMDDTGSLVITDGTNTLLTLTDSSDLGNLTITGDLAVNGDDITADGALTIQVAGSGSISRLQIGVGGAGSTTPDYLALDVKSDTGDPAGGAEGYTYYNTFDNKFRCFQGAAWTDCIGAGGSTTLQQAYDADADGSNATILTNATDGSIIIQTVAGTQFQVSASAAPTVDLASITNAGQGVTTTSGVDGLSIAYCQAPLSLDSF